jgi:hypothetical protein
MVTNTCPRNRIGRLVMFRTAIRIVTRPVLVL